MTLSVCLPANDELNDALLDGASYLLLRRGGFVYSETYAAEPLRKRDFYKFSAGSLFEHPFSGDVFDVSNGAGHPVYSYAKPLFIGVSP
jgi:CRISPR-associated protein Csm4